MRIAHRSVNVTNAIAARFGVDRSISPFLCRLARKRALETVTVEGHRDLTELPDNVGWGEVLAWRRFDSTPLDETIEGWWDSQTHHVILADPSYPVIGAAFVKVGDTFYFCAIVTTGLV